MKIRDPYYKDMMRTGDSLRCDPPTTVQCELAKQYIASRATKKPVLTRDDAELVAQALGLWPGPEPKRTGRLHPPFEDLLPTAPTPIIPWPDGPFPVGDRSAETIGRDLPVLVSDAAEDPRPAGG